MRRWATPLFETRRCRSSLFPDILYWWIQEGLFQRWELHRGNVSFISVRIDWCFNPFSCQHDVRLLDSDPVGRQKNTHKTHLAEVSQAFSSDSISLKDKSMSVMIRMDGTAVWSTQVDRLSIFTLQKHIRMQTFSLNWPRVNVAFYSKLTTGCRVFISGSSWLSPRRGVHTQLKM